MCGLSALERDRGCLMWLAELRHGDDGSAVKVAKRLKVSLKIKNIYVFDGRC